VSQWVKRRVKIQQESHYTIAAPTQSPDLSPCDFWVFGMLKGILKDREFHSHDEIEEAITMAWNDLTFHEVQSVFHNWMNQLRWVIENGAEYITE
jgi:hypothetical protein